MQQNSRIKTLVSEEDLSVNFVFDTGFEARYVRRLDTDYAIVYVSSNRGCNQACRFCHLTQTKQTDMTRATVFDFIEQTVKVLQHYDRRICTGKELPVKKMHFNWMARGEPLLNTELCEKWNFISSMMQRLANIYGVERVAFNISTIMPRYSAPTLTDYSYRTLPPTIFYSLYSVNPDFRKRWLPNAMEPERALGELAIYQEHTSTNLVLHWALIEGENDSPEDTDAICRLVKISGVKARLNLVRYNPFSPVQGKESSEEIIQARFDQLSKVMTIPGSRIVPRVGRDVYASCGTFINLNQK